MAVRNILFLKKKIKHQGNTVTATEGESGNMFANTSVHKIICISESNQDSQNPGSEYVKCI